MSKSIVLLVSLIISALFTLQVQVQEVSADDLVYIRASHLSQLITSNTLKWLKGRVTRDPVRIHSHAVTDNPNPVPGTPKPPIICRVQEAGLHKIGLLTSDPSPGTQDQCSTPTANYNSFTTMSGSASRLKWVEWARPHLPPPGAVSFSSTPPKYIASAYGNSTLAHLDPSLSLGSVIVGDGTGAVTTEALVLVEIDPVSYRLTGVELKKGKNYKEKKLVLTTGYLKHETPETGYEYVDDDRDLDDLDSDSAVGKIGTVLTYNDDGVDYWGAGHAMAKGLPTTIELVDEDTEVTDVKNLEWGIENKWGGKQTYPASAQLPRGTAVNLTLTGTKISGEMNYWATLTTTYADGSTGTRMIDGVRKVIDTINIHLDIGPIYFITNGTYYTTTTTTTTTTTKKTTTTTSTSTTTEKVNPLQEDPEITTVMAMDEGGGTPRKGKDVGNGGNGNGGHPHGASPYSGGNRLNWNNLAQIVGLSMIAMTVLID